MRTTLGSYFYRPKIQNRTFILWRPGKINRIPWKRVLQHERGYEENCFLGTFLFFFSTVWVSKFLAHAAVLFLVYPDQCSAAAGIAMVNPPEQKLERIIRVGADYPLYQRTSKTTFQTTTYEHSSHKSRELQTIALRRRMRSLFFLLLIEGVALYRLKSSRQVLKIQRESCFPWDYEQASVTRGFAVVQCKEQQFFFFLYVRRSI